MSGGPGNTKMRDPLHSVPVRYKLPLMFISVCLLAFGVGGYLVSGSARDALEGEILARLEFQSRAYATALEGRLQTLARRTEDFASDGYIRDLTEGLLAEREIMRAKVLHDELRAHLVENKLPLERSFADLCIVAADGEVLLATTEDFPRVLPEAITAGALDDPSRFSDFIPTEERAGPGMFISTPLYSRQGGRCLGRLVSRVRPSIWIVGAMRGSGLATDAGGDPVHLQLIDGSRQHLRVDSALVGALGTEVQSQMLESGAGLLLVSEARANELAHSVRRTGAELYMRSYPIGSSGWDVQVDLVPDNAFAPIGGLQNRFLGVGVILGLAASLLLFFPMRFLARPLLRLTKAARRLRDGDFASRVSIESSDELGELGESFNSMADAVQERTERLQHTAEDLRERQRELGFERDRLSAVISSMRDGLVVLDSDGRPVVHNLAAGPILQQILDKDRELRSHHVCEMREKMERSCRDCLFDPREGPRSCVLEIGNSVYEIHATRLAPDKSGRSGRVLVSRDLSDRIAQDERQIHQERLAVLGEVAAVMAHELNNPLAAINMYNQMTADDAAEGSEVAENSEVIKRNVQTCKRTIRELLDYATDATPEVQSVDIASTLQDVAAFLRPLRERSNVELDIHVPAFLREVNGDEVQIRQVFTNLIVNSIQALGARGGTVTVKATAEGSHVLVTVSDDGPGIPEEARKQIFRPFFTTKARGEGTGLGLPTSRRIAEMHGGGLDLVSTGPEGTCFRVRLSVAQDYVA